MPQQPDGPTTAAGAPFARHATRRLLLSLALAAPAIVCATRSAAAEACVDLDALPSGQKAMRQSLNFKLASDDNRKCGGCAFFSAAEGDCGKCQIFSGPVPAQGRCDSWAARK